MGRIIPLNGEAHHEMQLLLPWYATGRLDLAESARVEAHLEICADCRDELALERRLGAEIADLSDEVDRGWARMRDQVRRPFQRAAIAAGNRPPPRWQGWALAAQFLLLLAAGAALVAPRIQPPAYEVLGSEAGADPGVIVVVFRPDATESQLRATLEASEARIADGPTAAGAYVLRVPAARREAALASLRDEPTVALAQPIHPAEAR